MNLLFDYFRRTTEYWIAQAAEKWREQNSVESQEPLSEKELKKEGFMLAEIRFSELAPVLSRLNELEAQQAGEEQDEPKSSARGTSSRGAGHRQRY